MRNTKRNNINFLLKTNKLVYLTFLLFFVLTFIYFCFFSRPVLSFQEKQSLFLFSGQYLSGFLLKPGGLLEYTGKFLTQFYFYPVFGAFLLSTIISLSIILCFEISKKLTNPPFIPILIAPAALLLLLQSHYYHWMEYNLGFLLVLFFYNWVISPLKTSEKYLILLFIPLFYYVAGAYLFFFLGIFVIHNLICEKGKYRFTYSILAILLSFFAFVVFYKILFLQPIEHYFLYPLPLVNVKNHKLLLAVLSGLIIVLPLVLRLKIVPATKQASISAFLLTVTGLFAVTIFLLSQFYNPQTLRVLKMEHLVAEKKYDAAIRLHEESPSQNLIGQYFYNIALSETNQLCERLFFGRQDFGVNALLLPWSNEHLPWGAQFYYSAGLINEAHRWAYEEMVVYGKRPQNIELLLKTNLINGNYERAKKYTNILKTTINYKNIAKEYEKILADTTFILQHPDLMEKRKSMPETNFFIQIDNPQDNIPLLFQSNPFNKKAFEYEMAWLLLSKDVETLVNNLKGLKGLGYLYLPRHLEEAILIYNNGTGKMPGLEGLTIRKETASNFQKYVVAFKDARNGSARAKQNLQKEFGNTFMYYFHFN